MENKLIKKHNNKHNYDLKIFRILFEILLINCLINKNREKNKPITAKKPTIPVSTKISKYVL